MPYPALAEPPITIADGWLTNSSSYPPSVTKAGITTNRFGGLHAEAIAGRLKVFSRAESTKANEKAMVYLSADEPGHWAVRDWRRHEMKHRGSTWETSVPFESLDVPVIYFLEAHDNSSTNLSPMRICWPRRLGLQEAAQLPWNFIEGFEEGFDGWSVVAGIAQTNGLALDSLAHNGHRSLSVRVPSKRTSVTLSTTRIRGWQMLERGAIGLRLWLRTRTGTGDARFTLHANAFTPQQTVSVSEIASTVGPEWQQVDLPLASFPRIPLAAIDWFTIEFISAEAEEILIDDVQFIGRGGRELQ